MPCDTIQTNRVDIGKVDPPLLKLAMDALGVPSGAWTYSGGQVSIRGNYRTADGQVITQEIIRRAYSMEVVKSASKRYAAQGWQVKQTAPNKFQLFKR